MMLALCNDDSEPVTQVYSRATVRCDEVAQDSDDQSVCAEIISERPTLPEMSAPNAAVNAMADPWWARTMTRLWVCACAIWNSLRPARLSDRLPPVPIPDASETTQVSLGTYRAEDQGERLLLDVLRASPDYVDAAILVAHAANELRKQGEHVFSEGVVVFVLSRMHPDSNGTISVRRLRERLRDMPLVSSMTSILLRLEEQGVIALETPRDDSPASGIAMWEATRIRLLERP